MKRSGDFVAKEHQQIVWWCCDSTTSHRSNEGPIAEFSRRQILSGPAYCLGRPR